jgi:hypothetical protein
MPSRTDQAATERRLYSRLRQLLTTPGLLRGNLVEMRRACGKATCGCARDPARRHQSLYLGLSLEGRRRMLYIPPAWEADVRRWVTRYAEVRAVLEQITRRYLDRVQRREG